MTEPRVTIRRDAAGHVTSYRETAEDPATTDAMLHRVLDEAIAVVTGTSRRPPVFGTLVEVRLTAATDPRVIDLITEGPPPHTAGHVHVAFDEPLSPAFREAVRAMYAVYLNGTAAPPAVHTTFEAACQAIGSAT